MHKLDSYKEQTNRNFGMFQGVLIPNITMMFGVILFLRLGLITASSGLVQMYIAIGLSLAIMLLTSFSIGSLATNMKVGDGGIYYIISRTLGVEIGGAIGIAIYIAQLISISLTVSGFSISFCEVFPNFSIELTEICTLLILAVFSGFSANWALQIQSAILVLLLASIGAVFMGSTSNIVPMETAEPFYGVSHIPFWIGFAMFYPALTGIEAGMALSGSLKNPGRSIFYGNVFSLIFVALIYTCISTYTYFYIPMENLISDPFVLIQFSYSPKLVTIGIWAATLSSALGSLLGAPRMLQAMSQDGVISENFSYTQGKHNEPRIAMLFTVIFVAAIMLFTTIDQIIPMLTMICLVSYGLLNFVAAFSELINIPSWRPEFKVHWTYSMTAAILIIITMFMITPGWTFATFLFLFSLYAFLRSRDIESGFQDLRDSFVFFISRLALYRLEDNEQTEALTWHPQILTLVSSPDQSVRITNLTHSLTRRSGILTFVTVIPKDWNTYEQIQSTRAMIARYFEKNHISCLSDVYPCESYWDGYQQLIKAYGIGNIQPNTIAMEISKNAMDDNILNIISVCRLMKKNILFLHDNPNTPIFFHKKRMPSKKKKIDIWWNSEETLSFDLTWSLVSILKDGLAFHGAKVTVKACVDESHARVSVEEYLKKYLKEARLKADVKVYQNDLIPADEAAPLTFVCLSRLPENSPQSIKTSYLQSIQAQAEHLSGNSVTIFVSSYDDVNHGSIYSK